MAILLEEIVSKIGEVGMQLFDLGAAEAAAGNISVCVREGLDVDGMFPKKKVIVLPVNVAGLTGATIVVTGSGRRLRDIQNAPGENLACIHIGAGGNSGVMHVTERCPFQHVTSEFNSHLAIHHDRIMTGNMDWHTVLHAQPIHLTYLSHIRAYQDERYFNQHLFRWQPETILSMPQGIGVLPFIVNGSAGQVAATVDAMRDHPLVVWAKHGVVARADESVLHALDLIEYAETAAHYETLNLSAAERAEGLRPDEIRQICALWGISQSVF